MNSIWFKDSKNWEQDQDYIVTYHIEKFLNSLFFTIHFFLRILAYLNQSHFLAGFSFLAYGAAAGFSTGLATTGAFLTGATLTIPAFFWRNILRDLFLFLKNLGSHP